MDKQDILRMAREANSKWDIDANWLIHYKDDYLERFAALVAAAAKAEEREACVLTLERNADKFLDEIVAAIRARRETHE
jgi:hypothetical protein